MTALRESPRHRSQLVAVLLLLCAVAALALAALTFPAASGAHAERATTFPDPNQGAFPQYRTDGPYLVVCRKDTRQRIADYDGAIRKRNFDLLRKCKFANIQAAVNRATNGTRIFVLPGLYRELPSRLPAPAGCEAIYSQVAGGNGVLTYDQERQCPHAKNLIAVMGDTNNNGICDSKCNIQIEGTGESREDVIVQGERFSGPGQKLNLLRADRADGIYIKHMTFEYSDFNDVYFLETNGFRIDDTVTRWGREYGILSFTSDHGIYENCEAYGDGDSGLYPGSGPNGRHGQPDAHGDVYGIIIRNCDSHDNLMGYSSTAGNGTWAYHNRFHHNGAGLVTDAIVSGHPGMPPDHSKWTENLFYSNNKNLFSDGPIPPGTYTDDTQTGRDEYCKQSLPQRDLKVVCPSFFMPIGTGMVMAGANSEIVENNWFFDNWRIGTMLLYVPATLRGQDDSSRQTDTSNNNRQAGNCMDTRPFDLDPAQLDFTNCEGTHDSNGLDFWWDSEEGTDCLEVDQDSGSCVDAMDGIGNCWTGNIGFDAQVPSSDPPALLLPGCPGLDFPRPPDASKSSLLVPCVTWDPQTNTDPPGCETPAGQSWFDQPSEPQP